MAKVLKVAFPEKCIRCELCIIEAQRQLQKFGLDGALIRIHRNAQNPDPQKMEFVVYLDPQVNKLDVEKIKNICPTGVFTIEEEEEHGLLG